LLGVWRETCIADRDSVKGLEVVHNAECAALLLDAKPAGVIQGIRRLVHASSNLLSEKLDDLFEDAWWDGEILVCPRDMLNNWDLDRIKVLILETTFLCLHPC